MVCIPGKVSYTSFLRISSHGAGIGIPRKSLSFEEKEFAVPASRPPRHCRIVDLELLESRQLPSGTALTSALFTPSSEDHIAILGADSAESNGASTTMHVRSLQGPILGPQPMATTREGGDATIGEGDPISQSIRRGTGKQAASGGDASVGEAYPPLDTSSQPDSTTHRGSYGSSANGGDPSVGEGYVPVSSGGRHVVDRGDHGDQGNGDKPDAPKSGDTNPKKGPGSGTAPGTTHIVQKTRDGSLPGSQDGNSGTSAGNSGTSIENPPLDTGNPAGMDHVIASADSVAAAAPIAVAKPKSEHVETAADPIISIVEGSGESVAAAGAANPASGNADAKVPSALDGGLGQGQLQAATRYSLVRDGRLNDVEAAAVPTLVPLPEPETEKADNAVVPARAEIESEASEASADPAGLGPRSSGLLSSVLAADLASLEAGVQKFFQQIEGLGWHLTSARTGIVLSSAALTGMAAVMTLEIARRQRRLAGTALAGALPSTSLTWLRDCGRYSVPV
jgi:hypothetical protein